MNQASGVRAVIFDLSGTVIDFGSRGPAVAFVELFARHGVQVSIDEARRPMGTHKRDHIATMLSDPTIAERWREVHRRLPDAHTLGDLYEEFGPLQTAILPHYCELIPGVSEVTRELRSRGVRFASTTGFDRSMIGELIRRAAEQGYEPDAYLTPNDVGAGRPAPWMAFEAARRMNVYPMRSIVKVGDTEADIAEARNAGMWSVAVIDSGNEVGLSFEEFTALTDDEQECLRAAARARIARHSPDFVIGSVADLLPVLDEIGGLIRLNH